VLAGALCGVVMRLIFFNHANAAYSTMGGVFIYLSPVLVGVVTVYVAETQKRRSWAFYFFSAGLANVLFILGTMLLWIEGLICALIISPLFMLLGGLAGLLMGAVCRWTNWPRHTVLGFAVVPLLAGLWVPEPAHEPRIAMVERTAVVPATPAQIWPHLMNAKDIRADEVGAAWMYRIGVPLPESGLTTNTPLGLVRSVKMGKAIHFEQVATDWAANHHVRWTYRFQPNSFPPHALDDHVAIGGHHFDVLDTTYTLTPLDAQTTQLKVQFHYRVNTDFDWYANTVARWLIGNFEDVILDFYSRRATQPLRAAQG
jgi:hypothetical protein